jgi:hypothetical protein
MKVLTKAKEKLIDEANEEATQALESFENRWRYAVFPAMIAFIILAVFGFYLIYGMLQRMEQLSTDVNRMTSVIAQVLPEMQRNMGGISTDISELNQAISANFPKLEQNIASMTKNMNLMSSSTHSIATTTANLDKSMWEMNRNVSKPLSMINQVIPWRKNSMPPLPYPSNPYQRQAYNP